MYNTFEAQVKIGSGLVTVSIQCDNTYHARILLERQYGAKNVINLHQKSNCKSR